MVFGLSKTPNIGLKFHLLALLRILLPQSSHPPVKFFLLLQVSQDRYNHLDGYLTVDLILGGT